MNPACSDTAIGISAGIVDDRILGSVSTSDGCHQPSQRLVA